jgi:hypothetical protein
MLQAFFFTCLWCCCFPLVRAHFRQISAISRQLRAELDAMDDGNDEHHRDHAAKRTRDRHNRHGGGAVSSQLVPPEAFRSDLAQFSSPLSRLSPPLHPSTSAAAAVSFGSPATDAAAAAAVGSDDSSGDSAVAPASNTAASGSGSDSASIASADSGAGVLRGGDSSTVRHRAAVATQSSASGAEKISET